VGEELTIATIVKDDGIPKPRNLQRVAAAQARAAEQSTGPAPATTPPATTPAATTPAATTSGAPAAPSGAAAVAGAILGRNPALLPPTRITVGKNLGLHVSWFVYRGAGKVTFEPPQVKAWEDTRAGANSPWAPLWSAGPIPEDGKQEVHVWFYEPGTYILRCRADDGALLADEEVTIVVTR